MRPRNSLRKSSFRRLGAGEQLEDRAMLSAHGLGFGASLQQFESQFSQSSIAEVASHAIQSAITHLTSDASHTVLSTQLTDSSGSGTGTATYSTSTVDGTTVTSFNVSITGATSDTTLDVAIGGTVVGQITTDSSGAGTLSLSSNPTSSQQALPSNFPTTVAAGTAVTVGTLSGTLATSTDMSGGCGGEGDGGGLSDVTRLTAQLTDSSSTATGKVSYTTGTAADGTTVTRFKVTVTGATASTTLDVAVGGTVVGQITTDSSGDGSLILSSNPKDSNEQSLPTNFPTTITSGTAVTVGTLSGTLATPTDSSSSYSGFRSFFRRH